ncbi:MAG: photosystem reaction center protein H [Proteobacteria bacterium]|nr:photosystem reaction center protein H [Pseudomonadota bacterium]
MQKLLLTTILATGLGVAGAIAQTVPADNRTMPAEIIAPEGFQVSTTPLTAEDLLDATVYDSNGDSIGDVHDLVFAEQGATGTTMPDASTSPGSTGGAVDGTTSSDMATGTSPGAGTSGSTADQAETGAPTGTEVTNPPDMDAENTTDSATTGGTLGSTADTTTATTDPAPRAEGLGGTGTMDRTTSGTADETPGELSHAILDVGGFLGIGEHRVAVPVSDLQVYRSADEVRIYLPWTQEQLESLPEYVEGDMATYGRSLVPHDRY